MCLDHSLEYALENGKVMKAKLSKERIASKGSFIFLKHNSEKRPFYKRISKSSLNSAIARSDILK